MAIHSDVFDTVPANSVENVITSWGMGVDAKKMLEKVRLKGEPKKGRITLYIDLKVYDDFKKACEGELMSRIVEEFMRDFADSAKGKK